MIGRKYYLCLIISCSLFIHKAYGVAPEFVLIVPSYNNERWYQRNLDSLVYQHSSKPCKIYYVNDRSLDSTGAKVESYIKVRKLDQKVKVIHNQERIGALANIYNTVHRYCKDHQVVVLVDGDDFLQDPYGVLLYLENIYKDPDIWMTYGQFRFWPSGELGWGAEVPRTILEDRRLRSSYRFTLFPLRTFKAGLFKKIKKEDLLYQGRFLMVNHDVAIMIPMVEMCAPKDKYSKNHSVFIREPLYRYNYQNPISDFRLHWNLQQFLEKYIRAKQPYRPLDKL